MHGVQILLPQRLFGFQSEEERKKEGKEEERKKKISHTSQMQP